MKTYFENSFEQLLKKLKARLPKKHTRKKVSVIDQSIGRLTQRYPSVAKYYDTEVKENEEGIATEIRYKKSGETGSIGTTVRPLFYPHHLSHSRRTNLVGYL